MKLTEENIVDYLAYLALKAKMERVYSYTYTVMGKRCKGSRSLEKIIWLFREGWIENLEIDEDENN
jgi:hypothetical protein